MLHGLLLQPLIRILQRLSPKGIESLLPFIRVWCVVGYRIPRKYPNGNLLNSLITDQRLSISSMHPA